jgi:D-alanyl-D-alanine carboxypeptidase
MIKKILALAFLAVGLNAGSYAQTINKTRLDSLLNVLAANNKSIGSLAISQNGQLVYQKVSVARQSIAPPLSRHRLKQNTVLGLSVKCLPVRW